MIIIHSLLNKDLHQQTLTDATTLIISIYDDFLIAYLHLWGYI